ncbi:hypothetical protein E4T43_06442 [Aureobasidium subglaciale]|nr:hypothetical protein E4T43_06442 [Aureobasidium subglaciale]
MQFTTAAVAAFAASASAAALNTTASSVYVTEVVNHLTTICPASTVITAGSHTITVNAATTLTISNCNCTITKISSTAAVPTAPVVPVITAPYNNSTVPATPTQASGYASGSGAAASSTKPTHFTGAASMNTVPGAIAAFALAAFAL